MSTATIIVLVIIVLAILITISMYNGLIRKKNDVANAFGGMDVQLKKRYDLLPNLIETVKQYMAHERELLTKITELRGKAMNANISEENELELNNQISTALKGIMVAVENYPELKANTNFLNLQRTMNEVESQISAARRAYNAAVTAFNNSVQMFPSSIIAGMMHLETMQVFEIPDTERENYNAKELFNN